MYTANGSNHRKSAVAVLVLMAGSLPAIAQQKSGPTISQFVKIRWPGAGALAPDGTLYTIDWPDGINQLYRTPAGSKEAKKVTSFPDGISGYTLSRDGRQIAMTAAIGGSEQTSLYLFDTASQQQRTLREKPNTAYGAPVWRRDSKVLAYQANDVVSSDFYVYVYDPAGDQHTLVCSQPGHYSPVDFSADGQRLVVEKFTSASYSQLFEIKLADNSLREITPAGEQKSYNGVGYTADEASFLVVSNHGGDRQQVQRIELASGKVMPMFTEFSGFDVDFATLNEARTVLAVAVNEDGYRALHLRSLPDGKPIQGPKLAKGIVGNISFTGDWMLYSLDNANTPGLIYKWSLTQPGEPPTALTVAETQGIDVSRFLLPELVKYKSFDGLEIPAFVYLPNDFKKGSPIPFVVQFHGGPEGQYRPGFNRVFQYFLTRGIGVMCPNVRGSTGYGTAFQEMDNYKKRMDSVRDGIAAAEWLVAQGYSEKKRIAASGGSYGGFMTMAVITEAPEIWGAAADVVGIVNFETFLELTKDYRRALREAEYGPLTDREFLKSISPIYKIDRIQAPLFIAHGLNDPRVPINEALQLAVGLMKLGRPVEQLIFPDEGHGFAKEENRLLYYERLAEFFERHLKAGKK